MSRLRALLRRIQIDALLVIAILVCVAALAVVLLLSHQL